MQVPRPADEMMEIPDSFPGVVVDSVRWHPDAGRRIVTLAVGRTGQLDAREGDVIAGVLVYRIDPGSVELRMRSQRKTVLLRP